ncbi:Tic22 family protein [Crocosphaera sp. Alani8]|uniref:Tic22 family protein n=1 Tax=Crocosphaera sp. Alani8 TaxID=3038952 RepID=UPI00313CB76B
MFVTLQHKLISAVILGSICLQPLISKALPKIEVLNKLDNVPTFTIVDREGNPVPLELRLQNNYPNNNQSLALAFINPQDAINTLSRLTQKNPQLTNNVSVIPVSLREIYELLEENNNQEPPIQIVPIMSEIPAAIALLRGEGVNLDNPEKVGVPLFYAVVGEKEDYMILQNNNNQPYIPFYWTKKQVEEDINLYRQQASVTESPSIKIKTIPLSQFVETIVKTNNDTVKIMQIVPSAEQINTANQLNQ